MRVLITLFVLLAAACSSYRLASPDPPPIDALGEPPYGLGQICIVRPHSIGALVTFVVSDNGALVGATRGPSYFCYYALPGRHHITSKSGNIAAVDLEVMMGSRHFLEQRVRIGPDELTILDEAAAQRALSRCEYRALIDPPPQQLIPMSSDGTEPPG
jgi:hypothetical protein